MMSDIFVNIINMGITASYLIMAVVILRLLLYKAPKWIRMVLWGLVGIRLILPFSIESVFSFLPNKNPIGIGSMTDTVSVGMDGTLSGISNFGEATVGDAMGAVSQSAASNNVTDLAQNGGMSITTVLAIIWLVGVVAMLVYCIASYFKLKKRIYDAVIYRDGKREIFQSEKVTSPFVLGFLKPRVYLPYYLEASDMDFVIAHEKAHISRGDHWIKLIGFVILSVYWFHPLVWVSYLLMCRDIELACDERVIKEMDMREKKLYAQALVKCSAPYHRISACPLSFGEVGVKKRIMNVLHYKKPAFWIILVSLVLCGVVAVGFLTDPKKQGVTENYILPEQSEELEEQGKIELKKDAQEKGEEALKNHKSDSQQAKVKGLTSPPTMTLQDSLSSTLNSYVVTSGTYSWNYQTENPEEMKSVEASGSFPTVAVKGQEEKWLKLVDYNGIDYALYHAGFEVDPDRISIKEYDLLELGNMEPEVLSETSIEKNYILELRPRRIYEVTAEWDEKHLESNGFYGSAIYIFATDDDEVSLSGTEKNL